MPALLDLLGKRIGDDTIREISNQIGADHGSTKRAVAAALPLLIGSLSHQAQGSDEGARSLHRVLERDHDGSLFENLDAVLTRSGGGGSLTDAASGVFRGLSIDRRAADGKGILEHLLGAKRTAAEAGISKASDLDVKKVRQLLEVLAPIVMSALGRVRQEQNLDAGGLKQLLSEERSALEEDTPGSVDRGLKDFFSTEDDGQLIEKVARLGTAASKQGWMKGLLSGTGKDRR